MLESSRVGGHPQSYEMSDRGASSRASTAPSADQPRPNPVSGARPPSPASSSLGQWPPSPALHFRPLVRSSSATGLLVRLFARSISRGRRRFRRAGTSSTTCRSVRRISGTLCIVHRLLLAGFSIRDRSCLTRDPKLHLFGGILIGRGPGTRVPLRIISSRPERSSLRFLAIRGLRWQRRARSDLWRRGGLSHLQTGRSDLLARPLQGLLRPPCLQYLLLRRSHTRLRLHSRRRLGLRV